MAQPGPGAGPGPGPASPTIPLAGSGAPPAGPGPGARDYLAALQSERAGTEQLGRATAGANEASATGSETEQRALAEQADTMRVRELQRQKALDEHEAELKSMRDQVAAKGDIDYDQFFKQKGAGARIGLAVARGLGAFGAALTHSPNFAGQVIDDAIQRNIEQQKAIAKRGEEGIRGIESDLERQRQRFGDERQADAAEYIRQAEVAKLGLETDAKRSQSPILEANARLAVSQVDQRIAQAQMQLTGRGAGGAGVTPQQIAQATQKIYEDSKGGMSMHDAQRQAVRALGLPDPFPREPEPAGWSGKPGGASAQQAAATAAALPTPKSTQFAANPIGWAGRQLGIQSSEGVQETEKAGAVNAERIKALAANGYISARAAGSVKSPADAPETIQHFLYHPGDSPEMMRRRDALFRRAVESPATPMVDTHEVE